MSFSAFELKGKRVPEQAVPAPRKSEGVDLTAGDDRTFHGSKRFRLWPNCVMKYQRKIIGSPDSRILAKLWGMAENDDKLLEFQAPG